MRFAAATVGECNNQENETIALQHYGVQSKLDDIHV